MSIKKILIIAIYVIIILSIPILIDYLFSVTIRKKRLISIINMAEKVASKKNKDIILFKRNNIGTVKYILTKEEEEFNGKMEDIIKQLANNSCVIISIESLEYVNNIEESINDLHKVSGGDLFILSYEKYSPRTFWDYNIKNIMELPYYLPNNNEIEWKSPNDLQKTIQKIYYYVFKLVPHNMI